MSDFNFDLMFGDSEIELNCPKCKAKISVQLKNVGTTITCPKCKTKINLEKDKNFNKSVNEVNESLKDFEDTVNNFGK